MEVIEDIISQHKNITIINQENQGLSVARNNGIAAAKGKYILMPDSDDLLIENCLKPLLMKALETKVDLVVANFIEMDNKTIDDFIANRQQQQLNPTFIDKTGEQLFMEDLNPLQSFVWRTLYNRVFLLSLHLEFFPGITYQDRPFTHECYLRAKRCIKASQLLYIYRKGHSSAASFLLTEKKAKDYSISIAKIWEIGQKFDLPQEVLAKLHDNVARCCSMLMTRVSHEICDMASRNRIVDYFNQVTPQVNLRNGSKQTIYFLMLRKMPHTFINLRYLYAKIFEDRIRPYWHRFRDNL